MRDLLELFEAKVTLDERAKEIFNTSNVPVIATISEELFTRYMNTYSTDTDHKFECVGGNQKGYDVIETHTGVTYEVKSTSTSKKSFTFGKFTNKNADFTVLFKWKYGQIAELDYCLVFPSSFVMRNLNDRNNITSKTIKDNLHLATDITEQVQQFIDTQ